MESFHKIFPSVESVVTPFKGVLLDAYGVFWAGNRIGPFPGAVDTMKRLVADGKIVGVLSNSSQLSQKEIDKIKSFGLQQGTHFHFFLTSGEVAKGVFSGGKLPFPSFRKKFYVFGSSHPRFASHFPLFEGSPYEETQHVLDSDFIYLTIPHIGGEDQTDPQVFWEELREIKKAGIPMVCANPDRFAHEGNPSRSVVRQGSLAAYFEKLGGEVFYIGKPSVLGYEMAMELFAAQGIALPGEILMVGDTPETDIRGAKKARMKSALTVQTGMMAERILNRDIFDVIQALDLEDRPDFLIKRFATHEF